MVTETIMPPKRERQSLCLNLFCSFSGKSSNTRHREEVKRYDQNQEDI